MPLPPGLVFASLVGWSHIVLIISSLWIPCFAETYEDSFRKAAAYASQGKYDEAIRSYQAALLQRPNAPQDADVLERRREAASASISVVIATPYNASKLSHLH